MAMANCHEMATPPHLADIILLALDWYADGFTPGGRWSSFSGLHRLCHVLVRGNVAGRLHLLIVALLPRLRAALLSISPSMQRR